MESAQVLLLLTGSANLQSSAHLYESPHYESSGLVNIHDASEMLANNIAPLLLTIAGVSVVLVFVALFVRYLNKKDS